MRPQIRHKNRHARTPRGLVLNFTKKQDGTGQEYLKGMKGMHAARVIVIGNHQA